MTTSKVSHPVRIFVDMDGVVADFAKGATKIFPSFVEGATEGDRKLNGKLWAAITRYQKEGGEFWYDLEPMADAMVLWEYVSKYTPEILTACGHSRFNAGPQKVKWVAKVFGEHVKINLTEKAREKAMYAQPGFILIDDKMKAIQPWRDAGGIGILHTSATSTIAQLKEFGL